MSAKNLEEGQSCPLCKFGMLELEELVDCTCFISPPCDKCVNRNLVCNECEAVSDDAWEIMFDDLPDNQKLIRGG